MVSQPNNKFDAAHELRTPLTVIVAGLCLLTDHSEDLSSGQREAILLTALTQAKKLSLTIDQVLGDVDSYTSRRLDRNLHELEAALHL